MLQVEILKAGMLSTIQDTGRKGYGFYGIGCSGPLDMASAKLANLLVGNHEANPVIEMNYIPSHLRFSEDTLIALTGADMQFTVNGKPLKRNRTLRLKEGSILSGSNTVKGARAYMAIKGEWIIPKVWGSCSTNILAGIGGLSGEKLKKGDSFFVKYSSKLKSFDKLKIDQENCLDVESIFFERGPEWNLLKEDGISNGKFTIGPQSNRMGAVLDGIILSIDAPNDFISKAVFPGIIQCTPSGKLVVLLQDGQTTGGYPRVAVLPRSELDRFNQIRMGNSFTFMQKKSHG